MSGAEDRIKLTKRVVDSADTNRGRHYLWDGELRGFGLQVEASGTKTYFVRYRPKGHGRDGTRRFFTLGHSQPQITARYAHLDADPLRRAADIIGNQLSAALSAKPAALKSGS